jgi:hypothetical protein
VRIDLIGDPLHDRIPFFNKKKRPGKKSGQNHKKKDPEKNPGQKPQEKRPGSKPGSFY